MKLQRILSIATLFFSTAVLSAQTAPAKPSTPTKPAAVTKAAAPNAKSNALLDINTATPDQLKQLPGVGDAFTKRIIDGRPYTAKTQLLSRGILPKGTYDGVSSQIIAKHAAK